MKVITAILACVAISVAAAESRHPCVYFRAGDLPALREKAKNVAWAREMVARWHREVDSAVLRHADDPSFAPSRLQMNWMEGKRYTKAWTQGNFIPRREGNAKYPTIRLAYARTWGDLSNQNLVDYATVQPDECPDRTARPERPFRAGLRR